MKKIITLSVFILLFAFQLLHAATFTVSNNNDAGPGSLRQAILDANATAGADIVNVTGITGIISLTSGQMLITESVSIIGPGMALLTINQTTAARVFVTQAGAAISFTLQDITLNYTGPATGYSGGGGAILAGAAGASTTLTNVTISNFNMQIGNGGAVSASSSLNSHNLTITNCIFTNNKCGGAGGAVSFNSQGGIAIISGCTFSGNHTGPVGANTGGDGGAISTTGGGNGGTYTIEKNTFLNNLVENNTGHGGAIINTNGALTVRYNRFIGNGTNNTSNPPLANIIGQTGGSTVNTTVADNNWWGVNTGPGTNDATVLAPGGILTLTKWLQLKASASPTPICPTNVLLGNTSTVTASFLSNSAGESIAVSNLSRLIGLPITYSAVLGTLSGGQTTIQANGTATVLFTSNGTPGNGSVNAVVDNVPNNDATAKAAIFINTPASISGQPVNKTVCNSSTATFTVSAAGVPAPAFQWRKGTTVLTNGATGTGSTISGATTATLSIDNASDADEATDYNVIVSNSCASVTSFNVSLTVLPPPVVNVPTVTQPTCAVPSGTIVANATGEVTLEYSKDGTNWQLSNSFSGLAPGNYNISARLQNIAGCVTSYNGNPVVINAVPVPPVVTAPTVTQPTCAVPTGTIVINATGSGTLEYSKDGTNWQTSNTFSGLAPGNYNISSRLQSSTTCVTNYASNPVVINPVPIPPVVSAPTVTQPTCAVPTGTIVINATGSGTLEYSKDGTNWQTSNSFSGLTPGNSYNISARLQSSITCVTAYSGNPVDIDPVPIPPVVSEPTVTQPTCATPTGIIVVNATGSGTLEYSKDGTNWQTSSSFSGLAPGNYNISARLQSSPTCVSAYSSNPVVINTAPSAPVISAPTITQPTCATPTGTIVINATGSGTLEYSKDGTNWQTSNTFSGLAPGNYNIAARFESSPICVTNYAGNPVVINPVPIPPVVSVPTVTQPSCAIPTGTIVVNATGSSTLEYSKDGTNWQTSNSFSGLTPGNSYNISARLQSSPTCVTAYSNNPVVIEAVPIPPVVSAPTVTQPTCATPTGTIVVNATGSSTLEYSKDGTNWQTSSSFSGLAPGNYSISARLQSSPTCVSAYSSNPVVINTAPSAPVLSAPTVTQPTCATPTGTIVVNATGSGTLEYSKDGTNWQTSSSFSGLAPGNYNISARLQSSPTCVGNYSGNPVVLNAATGCTVPPVITCPSNITTTATAGSCSRSVSFAAVATGVPAPTIVYKIGSTVITLPYNFPVGTTTVKAIATNIAGSDDCTFTVTVIDNQPPVITTIPNPIELLWPPNHKYQTIRVADFVTSVTDNCGTIPISNVKITKVTSDEADDAPGSGDGSTVNDIVISSNCKSVDLRKERMDGGNGRVYMIYVAVADGSGNVGTASGRVSVRINQSGVTAINNGAVYTVNGCTVGTPTISASEPAMTELPGKYMLQNYPNPTNGMTTIRYELPSDAQINLALYDNLGQKVAQLAEGKMNAGHHQAKYDASKLAAGIYLYRLQAVDTNGKTFILNKKMIVAK